MRPLTPALSPRERVRVRGDSQPQNAKQIHLICHSTLIQQIPAPLFLQVLRFLRHGLKVLGSQLRLFHRYRV